MSKKKHFFLNQKFSFLRLSIGRMGLIIRIFYPNSYFCKNKLYAHLKRYLTYGMIPVHDQNFLKAHSKKNNKSRDISIWFRCFYQRIPATCEIETSGFAF